LGAKAGRAEAQKVLQERAQRAARQQAEALEELLVSVQPEQPPELVLPQ